jgi:hypothetical protein|tara:strand:- start:156 stop:1766 length:1611 start_codon:yes stop_codon:yes gene_type:complete
MIENSFIHISGIGPKTESVLWDLGIQSWSKFLDEESHLLENKILSKKKIESIKEGIKTSIIKLREGDSRYFHNSLKSKDRWRMFKNFKSTTAYLNIKTTELEEYSSVQYESALEVGITTITIYDGAQIKYYVNGQNLDDFKNDISDYNQLITYNGTYFDFPFIEDYLCVELFEHSHIDLKFALHSLGYSGGRNHIEKELGLNRKLLERIDGLSAHYLWEEYINNQNKAALETLLAYNIEDAINLEILMHKAFNLKLSDTPFDGMLNLEIPSKPSIPFTHDKNVIRNVKNKFALKFYNVEEAEKTPQTKELLIFNVKFDICSDHRVNYEFDDEENWNARNGKVHIDDWLLEFSYIYDEWFIKLTDGREIKNPGYTQKDHDWANTVSDLFGQKLVSGKKFKYSLEWENMLFWSVMKLEEGKDTGFLKFIGEKEYILSWDPYWDEDYDEYMDKSTRMFRLDYENRKKDPAWEIISFLNHLEGDYNYYEKKDYKINLIGSVSMTFETGKFYGVDKYRRNFRLFRDKDMDSWFHCEKTILS